MAYLRYGPICHIKNEKNERLVYYYNYFAITNDWMMEGGHFMINMQKKRIEIVSFFMDFSKFFGFFRKIFDFRPLILKKKLLVFPIETHKNVKCNIGLVMSCEFFFQNERLKMLKKNPKNFEKSMISIRFFAY